MNLVETNYTEAVKKMAEEHAVLKLLDKLIKDGKKCKDLEEFLTKIETLRDSML